MSEPNQSRTKVLEDIADTVDVESFTPEDRAELESFWAQQSDKVQAYVAGIKAMIEEIGETPGTAPTNLSQALSRSSMRRRWPRLSLASSAVQRRSSAAG